MYLDKLFLQFYTIYIENVHDYIVNLYLSF